MYPRTAGYLAALTVPLLLASGPALARQERTGQQVPEAARQAGNTIRDSWITMKVHSLFVPEDALEGSDIDVDTTAGVVTLSGSVPTQAARLRAVALAKGAEGVKNVDDKLRVGMTETAAARKRGREAGEAGREAARETGQAGREVGREAGGVARDAAGDARETVGTTGRAISDGWLKSKIAAQYVGEGALDNSDIDLEIAGGAVTLNGVVRTTAARERAESIAKGTDGVRSVKNNLRVDPDAK